MKHTLIILALIPSLSLAAPAWKTIQQASGDLNGDGRADKVIIEQQQDPSKIIKNSDFGANKLNTNPRRITVLLASANGFTPAAQANWLPPAGDAENPCLEDPLSDITIKKQVLTINMSYLSSCGSYGTEQTKYLYQLRDGKFTLIGAESSSFSRSGGYGTAVSINFNTHKIKASGYIPIFEEENGATPKKQQDRWTALKSKKIYTLADKPPAPDSLLEQSDKQLSNWLLEAS